MRKILIVAAYFFVFWILLPAGLIWAADQLDSLFFADYSLPGSLVPLGGLIIVLSFAALLYAVFQFRRFSGGFPVSALPPQKLIEKGVFAYWRHPIYLFACLIFLGISLAKQSYGFLLIVFPVLLIAVVVYIRIEELILVNRFGEKYLAYRKRVPLVFPHFINVLRVVAAPVFHFWFRIKIYHRENIPDSPPYFVVAAHRNYLDPFFVSYAIPHMIKHVCTFEMFRGRMKTFLFGLMGAIPKKRYKTDLQSNRMIVKALQNGYAVGIFPEGGRSWTGEMRSLKPETLKLLRNFHRVPILPVRLEGNYHSWPRWSDKLLKADLNVFIGKPLVLNPEMTVAEVDHLIFSQIHARAEIEKTMICKSKNRIGKLSMVIYRCPVCRGFETLQEVQPDVLLCRYCKSKLILQPDMHLNFSENGASTERTIEEVYQEIKIRENDLPKSPEDDSDITSQLFVTIPEDIIYTAEGECRAEAKNLFMLKLKGEIQLTGRTISVISGDETFILNLRSVDAVTVESNCKLQLFEGDTNRLTQFVFTSSSALLWQDLLMKIFDQFYRKKVITR